MNLTTQHIRGQSKTKVYAISCDSWLNKRCVIYLYSVLIHFTDVSYTENEAYNIVDHAKKCPCYGAGKSGDEKQMKDVYEELYI